MEMNMEVNWILINCKLASVENPRDSALKNPLAGPLDRQRSLSSN